MQPHSDFNACDHVRATCSRFRVPPPHIWRLWVGSVEAWFRVGGGLVKGGWRVGYFRDVRGNERKHARTHTHTHTHRLGRNATFAQARLERTEAYNSSQTCTQHEQPQHCQDRWAAKVKRRGTLTMTLARRTCIFCPTLVSKENCRSQTPAVKIRQPFLRVWQMSIDCPKSSRERGVSRPPRKT